MNNLKWTSITRVICTVYLLVSILIGLWAGGYLVDWDDMSNFDLTDLIGLIIMCVSIGGSVLSVSLVMVLVEMSENIYGVREKLSSIDNKNHSISKYNDNSWVCTCGKRNESKFCGKCGKNKDEIV